MHRRKGVDGMTGATHGEQVTILRGAEAEAVQEIVNVSIAGDTRAPVVIGASSLQPLCTRYDRWRDGSFIIKASRLGVLNQLDERWHGCCTRNTRCHAYRCRHINLHCACRPWTL
jgi:hypothetical protein